MGATAIDEGGNKRPVAEKLRRFGRWSGAAAACIGAVVLLGWLVGSDLLRSFLPGHVSAKPNTAVALLLAGAAQWLSGRADRPGLRTVVRVLLLGVVLISGATLIEYFLGRDFGIDQWLFREIRGAVETPFAGRMSLLAIVEFLLFAVTLELRAWRMLRAERWAGLTALAGLSVGLMVLLGYTFGAHTLYALGWNTAIALPTALAFAGLFAGALAAHPESGWMAIAVSRGAGGVLLRRLLPFALFGPWLIGWLSQEGSNRGLYTTHVDQVTVVLPLIFLFVAFLYQSARVLERLDEEREQRKRDVEALNRELEARVVRRTGDLLAANDELRKQAEMLHLAPAAIMVRDLEGRITFWSRGAEELYGWKREQAVGRTTDDLLHARLAEPLSQIEASVRRAAVWEGEIGHAKRDGEQITVASRWALQRDAQGDPAGFLEINVDITDRKRAESELRRLNRALKALSRCSDAVARASDERALLQRVCDLIVQIGGYPLAWVGYAEDDEEKTVTPVAVGGLGAEYVRTAHITWGDTERGRGPTGISIRSGRPCFIGDIVADPRFTPWREAALRHGYASVMAAPLKEGERSFGALNLYAPEPNAFDREEQELVTELAATLSYGILALRARRERDQAAAELRHLNETLERRVAERTAELAASSAEMEAFTYSVSHDLRAPLRHIDGFSKVLLDQCSEQLDDLGRHYLERVRHATQHMGRLVDDLLNLSHIGRRPLHLEETALGLMVREIADELQGDAGARAIEWRIASLPVAHCDPNLIRQVFFNLLSNAVKFTRQRAPAVIEVGVEGEELFVRDNGVGFDARYADKLFGVFQRLHRSEEFEGTGVGLATVRRILRKHGGDIHGDGAPGKGATFHFTLGRPEAASGAWEAEAMHVVS